MTVRRVLVVRHVPWEGPGLIVDALAARGIHMDISEVGNIARSLDDYDGLVVMGGPMRATDAILAPERELLRTAVAQSMPVLGICLGHQLLALALGGSLQPDASHEIGSGPIVLTEDSVLGRLGEERDVLHWHGDAVTPPPDARLLARSERCANQAFRMGLALGLQFHLEVDPPLLREWLAVPEVAAEYAGSLAEFGARFDRAAPELGVLAAAVFGDFAAHVAGN